MERLNDRWIRWIGLPVLLLLANLVYIREYQFSVGLYLGWSLLGMVYIGLVWMGLDRWRQWARQRYTDIRQTTRRVTVSFLGYVVITASAQLAFLVITHYTRTAPVPVTAAVVITHLGIGLLAIVVFGTTYEVAYYLRQYRRTMEEADRIQLANLQSQFDQLKNQVNPHFLFNSLTSLSALVAADQQKANEFLDELAAVYRYLLQSNTIQWVSLRAEIQFMQSLFSILRVRYGKAITFTVAVSPDWLETCLPTYSLQVLVDNAIRHNSILVDKPLRITIATIDSCAAMNGQPAVVVTNTIAPKTLRVDNHPGGLHQLAERFALLALADPIIHDDGRLFSVTLPLVSRTAPVS
ncbi:sensor histidine kinase [Spirosoma fluminis]